MRKRPFLCVQKLLRFALPIMYRQRFTKISRLYKLIKFPRDYFGFFYSWIRPNDDEFKYNSTHIISFHHHQWAESAEQKGGSKRGWIKTIIIYLKFSIRVYTIWMDLSREKRTNDERENTYNISLIQFSFKQKFCYEEMLYRQQQSEKSRIVSLFLLRFSCISFASFHFLVLPFCLFLLLIHAQRSPFPYHHYNIIKSSFFQCIAFFSFFFFFTF